MSDQEVCKCINNVLATMGPNMQMDGDGVELVKFQSGVAYLKFHHLRVISDRSESFRGGIEQAIKNEVPDVQEVVAVSDGDDFF